MLNPLSDPASVAGFWRPLTEPEIVIAANLIEVASAVVRRSFPLIDTWIADGTVSQPLVEYVIAEMIKSAVDSVNREVDAKTRSETVGPYAHSVTYAAASRLALSTDLFDLLSPDAVVSSSGGLGSARLIRPPGWC